MSHRLRLPASTLSLVIGLSALAADLLPPVVAPPEPDGMKSVFNGQDLTQAGHDLGAEGAN